MSHYDHLTYAIVATADIDALSQVDRDALFSTIHGCYECKRKSLDGTQMVMKWTTTDGTPANMPAHTAYDYNGIRTALDDAAWREAE